MPSNPIMNPLSKLTLIVRRAHVHKQKRNSISESTYTHRTTQVRQSFWAKMATLDLNQSIWRALWEREGGGDSPRSRHLSSYRSNSKWNSWLASPGCNNELSGKAHWEA